ncbi:tetratricopeptide repeat protein [Algoriphagus sp. H41]|uniref:Tetratricopeptide repeat protein n=1 Tax=Algoriphagus oliviformis TaxID=2811231 RepID=A0ABS3C4I5_9BACT|nr:tetratricopeptide repeat protein [Algoriphagus oliviformis]MBN7812022.1 tetratricopeptide repeat protein [Algoriphagus oliviformis]
MKKLILSLALLSATSLAFAQKKVVREAEKGYKSGNYDAALTAINAAATNPETSGDPATFLLKAQIQTKMFGSDSSNTMETVEMGAEALETYNKSFEMAGADKSSGVGKDVYAEDMPGVPDNMRPYSILTLKNISFDKGIERYNVEDLEMAYEFFNLAGEIDQKDTTIHYNAGFLANDLGKFEEAKKHFGYLLEVPEYNKLNAYYFMVQILSTEEKNPEAAYELVNKAKADYPNDKVLAEYEIQLLLQLNKMDEAMAQIKDALANDPNNTGLLLRSGYLKEQAGDTDGALVDYKKSVEVDPNFFEGNYYTGALLLEQATKMLNTLNDLSDAEWEKQSPIIGKKADENYKSSVAYFSKALELKPDNTDIMIILFQVHNRLKNTAEAEAMNKKLTELLGPNWQEN